MTQPEPKQQQLLRSSILKQSNFTPPDMKIPLYPRGKFLVFDDAGVRPKGHPELTVGQVGQAFLSVLALPYVGEQKNLYNESLPRTSFDPNNENLVYDRTYEGATNLEVAAHRISLRAASGDVQALDFILDRAIGKPKQTQENLNLSLNYEQFLDKLTQAPTTKTIAPEDTDIETTSTATPQTQTQTEDLSWIDDLL